MRTDPTRTLDRLGELRLIGRLVPVTEDPSRSRRPLYRVADNVLAFWLSVVDRYRPEIDRGLGPSILPVLAASLDDFLGPRYEEAFRQHLRRMAAAGEPLTVFGDGTQTRCFCHVTDVVDALLRLLEAPGAKRIRRDRRHRAMRHRVRAVHHS